MCTNPPLQRLEQLYAWAGAIVADAWRSFSAFRASSPRMGGRGQLRAHIWSLMAVHSRSKAT